MRRGPDAARREPDTGKKPRVIQAAKAYQATGTQRRISKDGAMGDAILMAEVWRGPVLECVHMGHAVICDARGEIVATWGDPETIILPRSSCKMIQALPLVESGAATDAGLTSEHLALACASHNGAHIHTDRVKSWLSALGLSDSDLRCGTQIPGDEEARTEVLRDGAHQVHNNCSGKHTGFLTLAQKLGGGAEYVDPEHAVQKAVRAAFEEMTGETASGFGIDGCSAPNFATSLHGLARAMSRMAAPDMLGATRAKAAIALVAAMSQHPDLISGEGRICTELSRLMGDEGLVKTGAEGVFAAILPKRRLGIALKISDGATRASEAAMAAILVGLGVLQAGHPMVAKRMNAPVLNRREILTGHVRAAPSLSERHNL